jgi:hypothetical protein
MRILSIILIAAVVLGAGYFYLNTTSYEPSTGTKIQTLPEQKVDDLVAANKARNADPSDAVTVEYTAAIANARAVATAAFETYDIYQRDLPKQARESIVLLMRLMSKGRLPTHFVSVNQSGYEQENLVFETLSLDPFNSVNLRLTQGRAMCDDVEGSSKEAITTRYNVVRDDSGKASYVCTDQNCPKHEYYDVMVGDMLANKFLCDPNLKPLSGDKIYLGGPGDDVIRHTMGNVIVDGGTGNDSLALGPGRKIMIFSQGWGKDRITLDCTGAEVQKNQLPAFAIPWNYDFSNFLIFGPGIQPEDLKFNGLEIEHITSGDKITFSDYCFNIVFAEDFQSGGGVPDKID